jgi:uncharacterized protein YkwD
MQAPLNDKQHELSFGRRKLMVYTDEAGSAIQQGHILVAELERVYRNFKINHCDNRQLEQLMLSLVNRDRTNNLYKDETNGLARPLAWHQRAAEVARAHSWDMAMRNYFSHHNPEGLTVAERVNRVKIQWLLLGENIAISDDVVAPHLGFMNEPPFKQNHRGNILNNQFTHCGIGVVKPSDGIFFVTQVFLKPTGV